MKTTLADPPYRCLLLEGIHPIAKELLESQGIIVESYEKALPEEELLKKIKDVHFLGIRSKTTLTKKIFDGAPQLLAVGCFCIGTNQVDLDYANERGVPVFNSPFANTRSVAELVMGEIICLARKVFLRSTEVHQGLWNKTNKGCFEIRDKTIGIIGYGHIGSQVGVMAEALGMRAVFYDVVPKLQLGNAKRMNNMVDVLAVSDFVTVHVPETESTKGMFGEEEFKKMKEGSYFLNLSRGTVVNLDALSKFLHAGHLAGAAIDVYPDEPEAAGDIFKTPLQGIPNVILTPHIGGSTVEAQNAIATEVANAFISFVTCGSTTGAVNFPELTPPLPTKDTHRITNVHFNEPGVLSLINRIVLELNCNIGMQYVSTKGRVGYLVMDMDMQRDVSLELRKRISELDRSIRTLIIFQRN
ncbi:D-3-phosphoglycerate dehydrogenase-like protein [Trypanosoma theileri]|uniref:D-3-phosphoglycerate dehydrogenase-like protein n=1 Tax=Trypanosoma theileri TaxID=67003 RepID=A0A1X0P8Z4_9TRYP|nr:D-3-phosphoglycerate dehydrogenase-like protein [Trypanosoma theileri]ORC93295.1 D-3-phosphoglycerate dehydrogenase-like protein [Trypanosoma theileri]